jgi:predicted dehydrogenase
MSTTRVGLIGCGDISAAHCRTYQALGFTVTAMCDTDRVRAEQRKAEFNFDQAEIYTNYQQLLARDDLDIVTVATPVALHAPITIAALRAGKQVACEKPSTLSRAENKAIVAAEEETGNHVIFFSARMRGGHTPMAKQYIDDGRLGELYRVDVRYFRRRGRPGLDVVTHAHWFLDKRLAGGGVVMDMGQYFMDQVLHLAGWPHITAVSAFTFRGFPHGLPADRIFDVEEHCTIFARTAGNCLFTFDFAWIAQHTPQRNVALLGTRGGIRMSDEVPFVFYEEPQPWRWMNTTTEWQNKANEQNGMYERLAAVARGEDVYVGTTAREALAITELTDMALLSAERGREVTPVDL